MEESAVVPTPPAAPAHALAKGVKVGGTYRIRGILGIPGPTAVVYRARREADGVEVAIKELFPRALVSRGKDGSLVPRDPEAARWMAETSRRTRLEAELLAGVSHAGVPRVLEAIVDRGTVYVVMELVKGNPLASEVANGGRLPGDRAGAIVSGMLGALEAMHAASVIHRNVTLENVLLTEDGQPVLVGLGAPHHLEGGATAEALAPLAGYAPIETYSSRAKGPWTDVYGAGAVHYRLLTGTVPPSAVDRAAGAPLAPPSRVGGDATAAVDEVIARAMTVRPEERPHDAAQLRTMLDDAVTRDIFPRRTPPGAGVAVAPLEDASGDEARIRGLAVIRSLADGDPVAPLPVAPAAGESASPLTLDPAGIVTVVPEAQEQDARRQKLWWGAAGLTAIVLVTALVVSFRESRTIQLETMAPTSAVAADSQAAGLTAAAQGVASAARAADATPTGASVAPAPAPVVEPPRPTMADGPPAEGGGSSRPLPLPVLVTPGSGMPSPATTSPFAPELETLPIGAVESLESALASARARTRLRDFAGAQRQLRLTKARLDQIAARSRPSASLAVLRSEIEREAQHAKDDCEAYNALARRRGEQVLPCG